jgi:hypothetical protein
LWELNELMAYWKDYPPTHVLVGAYLMGGKRSSVGKVRKTRDGDFGELSQAVASAGGSISKKLPPIYKT